MCRFYRRYSNSSNFCFWALLHILHLCVTAHKKTLTNRLITVRLIRKGYILLLSCPDNRMCVCDDACVEIISKMFEQFLCTCILCCRSHVCPLRIIMQKISPCAWASCSGTLSCFLHCDSVISPLSLLIDTICLRLSCGCVLYLLTFTEQLANVCALVQRRPRACCPSGSAGLRAAQRAGWAWDPESATLKCFQRTARAAGSPQRKRRSVWSMMTAVSQDATCFANEKPLNV